MTSRRTLLAAGAALIALVGGCSAAARLKALQPPPLVSGTALQLPMVSPPALQLGVDIAADAAPGVNVAAAAKADVAYLHRLHANAVSLTIPFFMHGPGADTVHPFRSTPTPAQVDVLAAAALRDGLYVSLRPLLKEQGLGEARIRWRPRDPARWFASYRRFLLPYAKMAQRAGIPELIVGSDFSAFMGSPRWDGLDAALRRSYHGTLTFANWWDRRRFSGDGGHEVREAVDAYPPTGVHFYAGWRAYDRTLPPTTVETGVGIAAAPGAYLEPWRDRWPLTRPDRSVQARWFSAACRAAAASHLGGIYFSPVDLNQGRHPSTHDEKRASARPDQLAWVTRPGTRAIAACFAALEKKAGQ
jgi:hypothetical protein